MRLLPATLGYSIIIVFRAIDGSMSETVCHTIFPNRKGKLDFSVVRNRSDWILDAYPFDEKYLPLIQTTLIQNTIEPSSNGQLVSTKLKEESSYVKETDNSKARSLVKAILNQFSREPPAQSRSQTTVEYDSPPSDIGSDDNNTSGSLQEVSPAIHVSDDSDEPIMEIDHQTGTSEDVIGNVSHESQDTVDSTKDIYHKAQQPTEMMNAETDANVIYQVEMNYNEKSMMNGHNSDIDDDNNSKEEKSMNDCEDEYQHDDLQESPEVTICSDYDMEHHIVKPIVSDTSVSSEDETYPSTTEKSKEASPDTSEADEVVQKIIRIPRVISAEEDEQKYEYIDDDQSSNVSMENEKQKANDLVFGNDFQSIAPPPPPSSSSSFVENTRLSFPFTPENLSAPTSLSSSYDQYQNQEENYMSDSPQSIPILSSTIITEESTNSNDPYPIFNTETATSVASPSPKMLKADEDTTSPSPLQLNNDDYHVHNTPSPYEYIPISPSDPPIQYQDEEEPEEGEIIESSSSPSPPYSNHVPSSPISSRGLFLQDQPQVNRERSVDQQLFIDVMLQELYYKCKLLMKDIQSIKKIEGRFNIFPNIYICFIR
ncbi:hypothetical protein BDA99DRAFT_312941 [Phascolomyces articulosus]|uniref:Uncharacterized protein n=1 Tax=Phascolomyces articulosus TaxID=60185 RepID=A0AAD5JKZ7_9FUNG|nr:hypothetical protein BDA99DRAFT_312941 [Phascolomyces articulosus]